MRVNKNILNEKFELKNRGYTNSQDSINLPRHRWYYFKEGFSPNIVIQAVRKVKLSPKKTIIDPFCGSGTVPLTASTDGFGSQGFEVNPFLAFVARTKLLHSSSKKLDEAVEYMIPNIEVGQNSPLETFSTFSKGGGAQKYLFNETVLRAFEGGWIASNNLPQSEKELVRLALLSATMDCCNATRDGKCLRYRKDWQVRNFSTSNLITAFTKRIRIIKEDVSEGEIDVSNSIVTHGDVRKVLTRENQKKFDLCVTSPPYLNSFDYTDVYRPELFLGKFVKNNKELYALRMQTVRSHVQANWEDPTEDDFGVLYQSSFSEIKDQKESLWDKRIPMMIQAYFEDMKHILSSLLKIANPGAQLWLVVSTSAYAGVEIPVDLIISDIGNNVGWELQEVGVMRQLRSSSHHRGRMKQPPKKTRLRESVIILKAPDK